MQFEPRSSLQPNQPDEALEATGTRDHRNGKAHVLIVDDHTLVREALQISLARIPDLEIVGGAADGREAIGLIPRVKPDLVLMDLVMPGLSGTDTVREIKAIRPKTKLLIVTAHVDEDHICAALEAGAHGYVIKAGCHNELEIAIKSVLSGKTYLSPAIQDKVVAGYLRGDRNACDPTLWASLSPREQQILKLIAEGHTSKAIAEYLCLSVKTVQTHRERLMKKLNLHSVSSLTAFAYQKGLI